MKKIELLVTGMCLSAVLLCSCLPRSSSWEGTMYGVLELNYMNNKYIIRTASGDLHDSNLKTYIDEGQMVLGDCYAIFCRLDYNAKENSYSSVFNNGYQTVTISEYSVIPKGYVGSSLIDNSYALPNEFPITKSYNGGNFAGGYLFLEQWANIPDDWELSWMLYYDHSTTASMDAYSRRCYDVYIRATVSRSTEKTSKNNKTFINAYMIGNFLSNVADNEKSFLGSNYDAATSTFTIRFKYVSHINEEYDTVSWGSDQVDILIALFESLD